MIEIKITAKHLLMSAWPLFAVLSLNINMKNEMTSDTGALALGSAAEEQEHKYTCHYFLMRRERNSSVSVITFGSVQTVPLSEEAVF